MKMTRISRKSTIPMIIFDIKAIFASPFSSFHIA